MIDQFGFKAAWHGVSNGKSIYRIAFELGGAYQLGRLLNQATLGTAPILSDPESQEFIRQYLTNERIISPPIQGIIDQIFRLAPLNEGAVRNKGISPLVIVRDDKQRSVLEIIESMLNLSTKKFEEFKKSAEHPDRLKALEYAIRILSYSVSASEALALLFTKRIEIDILDNQQETRSTPWLMPILAAAFSTKESFTKTFVNKLNPDLISQILDVILIKSDNQTLNIDIRDAQPHHVLSQMRKCTILSSQVEDSVEDAILETAGQNAPQSKSSIQHILQCLQSLQKEGGIEFLLNNDKISPLVGKLDSVLKEHLEKKEFELFCQIAFAAASVHDRLFRLVKEKIEPAARHLYTYADQIPLASILVFMYTAHMLDCAKELENSMTEQTMGIAETPYSVRRRKGSTLKASNG